MKDGPTKNPSLQDPFTPPSLAVKNKSLNPRSELLSGGRKEERETFFHGSREGEAKKVASCSTWPQIRRFFAPQISRTLDGFFLFEFLVDRKKMEPIKSGGGGETSMH